MIVGSEGWTTAELVASTDDPGSDYRKPTQLHKTIRITNEKWKDLSEDACEFLDKCICEKEQRWRADQLLGHKFLRKAERFLPFDLKKHALHQELESTPAISKLATVTHRLHLLTEIESGIATPYNLMDSPVHWGYFGIRRVARTDSNLPNFTWCLVRESASDLQKQKRRLSFIDSLFTLEHVNVIRYFALADTPEGNSWTAMEFCSGGMPKAIPF